MSYDFKKIKDCLKRCKWTHARSMIDIPHQYIHRDHCELTRDEFYYIVSAQRDCGTKERWGRYNFPYLYVDGYKYWTMGDPFPTTFILNRQKQFDEFNLLDWPLPRIYTKQESEIMSLSIMKTYNSDVFEVGLGNGDFVRDTNISPDKYYGIDPCKKALASFRAKFDGFYKRCSNVAFEESRTKWEDFNGVVIALFGTASYIMPEYLRLLSKSKTDYCLMFYRDEYTPEEYSDMHNFVYTKNDIKEIFPAGFIYNHKNFVTVSRKKIVWQNAVSPVDLFDKDL